MYISRFSAREPQIQLVFKENFMETMNHVLKLMEEIKCINVCGELYVTIATRERCLVIVFRKLLLAAFI